jgi:hypothetical protein
MRLRLTYIGGLRAAEGTATEKQNLRKHFHRQLRLLWDTHPSLRKQLTTTGPPRSLKHFRAAEFERLGSNYVPLVRKEAGLDCSVNILMLRPDPPGTLVKSGDLDNRIKTILDGLRMPDSRAELGDHSTPTDDEKPFYALLEDDGLITQLSIETDTLLEPLPDNYPSRQHVRLVIRVELSPFIVHPEMLR